MTRTSGIAVDGISATKLCAENVCGIYEYCSAYHTICEPCSNLCLTTSNNFNADKCITDCQDYLHDMKYLRKDDPIYKEYLEKCDQLTIIVYILVLVVGLLTLVMLPFLIGLLKNLTRTCRMQKLFTRHDSLAMTTTAAITATKTDSLPPNQIVSSNNEVTTVSPIDINRTLKVRQLNCYRNDTEAIRERLRSSSHGAQMMTIDSTMQHVPTLFTTDGATDRSIRVPIEGSTIDFAAYENRALNSSLSSLCGGGGGGGGGGGAAASNALGESSF